MYLLDPFVETSIGSTFAEFVTEITSIPVTSNTRSSEDDDSFPHLVSLPSLDSTIPLVPFCEIILADQDGNS